LRKSRRRTGDRRNGTRRTGTLRVDLQQSEKCSNDDDADEREEVAFVPVRENGLAVPNKATWRRCYFGAGSINPNPRKVRTTRASGSPITV
jgi:hypothetical protein